MKPGRIEQRSREESDVLVVITLSGMVSAVMAKNQGFSELISTTDAALALSSFQVMTIAQVKLAK